MTQMKIGEQLDENFLRHMILNSIRGYVKKFSGDYGELVIAADAGNLWRKKEFPYYKALRAKNREESDLDWNSIYASLEKIRNEIKEHFPYRVIHIDTVEADDIIGTLAIKYGSSEPVMILSGDKDFIQLQAYPFVKQYNPVHDKPVTHNNPEAYLKEHIIRGDGGDGIPNILSEDNCFMLKIRQKSIFQKKVDEWLKQEPEEFCSPEALRKFYRNEKLIDLSKIPDDIKELIYNEYNNESGKTKKNLLKYFMDNRLKHLLDNISDF